MVISAMRNLGSAPLLRPRIPNLAWACVVALVAVALATLLTLPLRQVTAHSLSLLFVLAVMFSSWYGGLWPGMLAVVAATLSFDYFFDVKPYVLDLMRPAGLLRAVVFAGVATLVASLTAQSRAALRAAEEANAALQQALDEVRVLRGIICICMYCKHIRNDVGAWERIEKYIAEHSEAAFSHGVCPDCYQKHHPEIFRQQHGG